MTDTPESSIQELAFLKDAGEDFSDLRGDLESMLRRDEPAAKADAPVETRELRGDSVLPIREDGTIIEPQRATEKPVSEPAPKTQAEALDPYAPDGASKAPPADGEPEPGEVVLDSEGKVRDAKTGRYVPHHAMHQERVRRKELETELAKRNEDWARAQERLTVLQEIVHGNQEAKKAEAAPPAAPEAPIDPDVDIFGWAKQQANRAEAAERKLAEIEQNNQRQYGELATQNKYRQDVTSFATKNADFFDAYKFVADMRTRELQALGFTDEKQIASQLAAEERGLVRQELEKNGSPSARLYALAKAKGYMPKSAEPAPTPLATPAPTATPAPVQQQQTPQPSPAAVEQVQRIQNGVNASASLSGAGGTGGEGLTVQQIAEMPDDQFDALVAKIGFKRFDKLLGGR